MIPVEKDCLYIDCHYRAVRSLMFLGVGAQLAEEVLQYSCTCLLAHTVAAWFIGLGTLQECVKRSQQ